MATLEQSIEQEIARLNELEEMRREAKREGQLDYVARLSYAINRSVDRVEILKRMAREASCDPFPMIPPPGLFMVLFAALLLGCTPAAESIQPRHRAAALLAYATVQHEAAPTPRPDEDPGVQPVRDASYALLEAPPRKAMVDRGIPTPPAAMRYRAAETGDAAGSSRIPGMRESSAAAAIVAVVDEGLRNSPSPKPQAPSRFRAAGDSACPCGGPPCLHECDGACGPLCPVCDLLLKQHEALAPSSQPHRQERGDGCAGGFCIPASPKPQTSSLSSAAEVRRGGPFRRWLARLRSRRCR